MLQDIKMTIFKNEKKLRFLDFSHLCNIPNKDKNFVKIPIETTSYKNIPTRKGELFMKGKKTETKVKLLSIKQASMLVEGLTEYRIRKLCTSGELPCFKSGHKYLINELVLLDYINKPQNQKENI